jgi:hypothetical protein
MMNTTVNESESLALFKRYIEGYLLSCVGIAGLIGNSITCLSILSNRTRRSSATDIYILGLSFTSIFILAGFLLTHGIRYTLHDYGEKIYRFLFMRVFPAHMTCLLIQIYLTAAIAIDRFLLICCWRSVAYRQWRNPTRTAYILLCISLFAILYCLPFWFEHEIINDEYIGLSSIGSQRLFRLLMRTYLYFIFVFLLPLSCIIACTAAIVQTLCRMSKIKYKTRSKYFPRRHSSRKIHTLLLSIVFIFLSTQLPYFIFNVIYALHGPDLMENLRARQYLVINNLLLTINASTTFILYALFGTKKINTPQRV